MSTPPSRLIELPAPPSPAMPSPPASRPMLLRSPPRPEPWPGRLTSPGIQVDPGAVDYFQAQSSAMVSQRALKNLAFVAGGRVTLALGLGSLSQGFSKRAEHHYALGGVVVSLGLVLAGVGIMRSYNDTANLNVMRARTSAAASALGALLVAGGGILIDASEAQSNPLGIYEATPLRALGNFLIFGAIPNSFSASEVCWGDVPIRHRVIVRDLSFALGGAFMMVWGHLSMAEPPAPVWARESAQCLGIVGLALSGALSRTDMSRAQAQAREALRLRRASSAAAESLPSLVPAPGLAHD